MTATEPWPGITRNPDQALRLAARARKQAECLAADAPRAAYLSAAVALTQAAATLAALRNDIALQLAVLRRRGQSHSAYARAGRLGSQTRGDRT